MMIRRNFIFHTGQYTQFTFYSYIKLMSVINNLLSQSNVFFVRQVRTKRNLINLYLYTVIDENE